MVIIYYNDGIFGVRPLNKIEENQCSSVFRKDCVSKVTCLLRHANEEAGKELDYYARKYKRADDLQLPSPEAESISFPVANFVKESARGDGHCIIHSISSLLEKKGIVPPKKSELLAKVKDVFQRDLDLYAPFIDGWETDPISELDAYINDASYDSNIADLIIPLLANMLGIGIVVMKLDHSNNMYREISKRLGLLPLFL